MNVREGMRRLGILLGACGGILGAFLGYSDARTTWDTHVAHGRFESLMASPIMQKVAKAAHDYQNGPWMEYRPKEWSGSVTYADGTIWADVPSDSSILSSLSDEQLEVFKELLIKKQSSKLDVRGLMSDPKFQKLPLAQQKLALGHLDSRFSSLSDEDFNTFKQKMGGDMPLTKKRAGNPPVELKPMLVLVELEGIRQVIVDKAGVVSSIELSTGESVQRVEPPALRAYLIPLLYPVLGFLLPWGGVRVLTWVGSGFVEAHR